jgi:excisionase family DNA binding protein
MTTTDDQARATLKIPEAAKIAGVGTRAIYNGVADGKIPHLKFGRNILIPRSAFMRWLDSCGGAVPTASDDTGVTGDPRAAA